MPSPIQSQKHAAPAPVPERLAARVVLVVNEPIRRRRMLELIQASAPQCLVEVVAGVLDGMARSTSMPAHLLVVDAAVDRPVIPTLVRYLARTAPMATVHVFDSLAGRPRDESLDNSEEFGAAADDADGERLALERMREAIQRWLSAPGLSTPSLER
jgi:hypothetical protein